MYEHSLIGYKSYLKNKVAWTGYENYLEHYLHHDGNYSHKSMSQNGEWLKVSEPQTMGHIYALIGH